MPHRISTVPSGHHYLTALQQQEVAAALPSTIDFLNEGGQVLQALPPPLLKEEKLREREEKSITRRDNKHAAYGINQLNFARLNQRC